MTKTVQKNLPGGGWGTMGVQKVVGGSGGGGLGVGIWGVLGSRG